MYPLFKRLSLPAQRCFIKYGRRVRLTEAITSEFIVKNTTIPVPRILDVYKYDGTVHIVQEFIDAPLLFTVWRKLSVEVRSGACISLRDISSSFVPWFRLNQERSKPSTGKVLLTADLGLTSGDRLKVMTNSTTFFHDETVRQLSSRYPRAQAPLAVTKGRTWRTVFAHGDLGPHNILWNMNRAEIAAIIDWEFSGWFPEYWDYTRAYFGPAIYRKNYGWWEMFQECTQCYPDELAVETVLSDYFTLNL